MEPPELQRAKIAQYLLFNEYMLQYLIKLETFFPPDPPAGRKMEGDSLWKTSISCVRSRRAERKNRPPTTSTHCCRTSKAFSARPTPTSQRKPRRSRTRKTPSPSRPTTCRSTTANSTARKSPASPEIPLTCYEQSKPAYQRARRAEYERVREQERLARAERQQALSRDDTSRVRQARTGKKHEKLRKNAAEYAEWLYSQGLSAEEQQARQEQEEALAAPAGRGRKKQEKPKRHTGLRILAVLVLLLAILTAAFHFLIASQPEAENALSARKPGTSTILVAGTDEGGYRTDSMMLVNVDRTEKTISLVSIPRDTLIYCEYSVPKINSAYGWAGGGEQGMQELLLRVSEIIGFTPDGYIVVDLSIFRQLVDLMGGVTFDVPVDMHYSDPTQDLSIDLQAGKQHLNGEQAMQVARFRSGYATADLGRIEVQRALVSAAIRQWVSPKGAIHLPQAVKLVADHTNTDLSTRNLLWLAESFLLCSRSDIRSATLPGYAANFSSGSYYVLDAAGVADIVNQYLNPYEKGVEAVDLFIRNG